MLNKQCALKLDKAIELHQKGRLDEAENIYLDLLIKNKNNFDIYHLLGIIELSRNELHKAIDLFKKGILINSTDEKVFNHLAIAEMGVNKLDNAYKNIQEALKLNPNFVEAHNNLGLYYEKISNNKKALEVWKKTLILQPNYLEVKINIANLSLKEGNLNHAISLYENILSSSPNHSVVLNNLGAALIQNNEIDRALKLLHHACTIDKNYFDAHHNLGGIYIQLKKYEDAIEVLLRAIQINPNSEEVHNKIAISYREIGNIKNAYTHFCKAIHLDPQNKNCLSNLAKLISENHSEIMQDKNLEIYLSRIMKKEGAYNPREISKYFELKIKNKSSELKKFIHEVAIDELTLNFLQKTPITDYEIEEKFTKSRQFLLQNIEKIGPNENLLKFLNSMGVQCFINEFIWNQTAEETQAILRLEDSIFNQLQEKKQVTALKLLLLSCYKSLGSYQASSHQFLIDNLRQHPDVIRIHIEEPSKELLIREKILNLTDINNPVSNKVRKQYESNPYPRWIATRLGDRDVDCNMLFDVVQLNLDQKPTQFSSEPSVLIAGCGTGQHAITTATRFKNSVITAIDLSKSSLSYAIRKSSELDIKNIHFYQADILELISHQKKYDLIESCGVLHHMEDTFEAWKILTGLVKQDGLMKIALYSSAARQEIGVARGIVRQKNLAGLLGEIREMRHKICHSSELEFKRIHNISNIYDFFTASECRDLLFHVQERSFSLPEIAVMADKLGLVFLGFEFSSNKIKSQFSKFNPQASPYSLADWHNFEVAFPYAFFGMYQMWFKVK
jgi:tetratricopeptide (TPR) repeat protein/2-polyprenyl-3-methyl-5-hydroxy-6-metoxy-1,4-benzoquinol methylase